VIILDIDLFKNVNDTYGHYTGDRVIQEFTSILQEHCRKTDTIGRWGGEEFIIIASQTDKDSIIKFAEHIRSIIEDYNFATVNHITASFGATLYKKDQTIEETIARADKALYASKHNGRNKVTFQA
jgi:diguanylate cyclase (GGDEF)-like protein